MNQTLYDRLVRAAREGKLLTYGKVAPLVHLDMANPQDRKAIGELLGVISRQEHRSGRPMLSSIVVQSEGGRPGKGFFTLAAELRLFDQADEEDAFWALEVGRTFEFWAAGAERPGDNRGD